MTINGLEYDIDLGHDHWMKFTSWSPDRDLNPQYADLSDNDRIGAIVAHKRPDGQWCQSSIMFDCTQTRRGWPDRPMWVVESWDPLTVSPSLLCKACGDHGFIREGRWVAG